MPRCRRRRSAGRPIAAGIFSGAVPGRCRWSRAGAPPPDGRVGAALTKHPGISKVSFTGSTEVGRIAMRAAAERILPVSLELGGKAPAIVYAVVFACGLAEVLRDTTAATRFGCHERWACSPSHRDSSASSGVPSNGQPSMGRQDST